MSETQRLAEAITTLTKHRAHCATLRELANGLRRSGLVVIDGEVAELEHFEALLAGADAALSSLASGELESKEELRLIEQVASDPSWALTSVLEQVLTTKQRQQTERRADCEARLSEQRDLLTSLREAMIEARAALAVTRADEKLLRTLDDVEQQARRALDESQTEQFARKLEELAGHQLDRKIGQVRHQTATAPRHWRHAELLVIRTPDSDRKQHHYAVILRAPGVAGSLGSSIRGTSKLTEAQRNGLLVRTAQLERNVRGTRDLNGGGAADGGAAVDIVAEARRLGDHMFRIILPEPLQATILDADCSVTITTNDLELPWELMHRRDTFMCLDRPVARMPMGTAAPGRRPLAPMKKKLRFLLLAVNHRGDLPNVEVEIARIESTLKSEFGDGLDIVMPKTDAITSQYMMDALSAGDFDVIHYAGHAAFDRKDPASSALDLTDGPISAEIVGRLLEGNPFVFLNACETGSSRNEAPAEPADAGLSPSAEGLASAFIYGGAAGCIGNLWPIHDDAAADFAIDFYRRLMLDQHPFGKAMLLSRQTVRGLHADRLSWASFVLFGHPLSKLNWKS